MGHAFGQSVGAVVWVLAAGLATGEVEAQQLTCLPFDLTLRIYVGHRGTWVDYVTGSRHTMDISDAVRAFRLHVMAQEGGKSLFWAVANTPGVEEALVFNVLYGWRPNKGEQHEGCPVQVAGPYGDPVSLDGKVSTERIGWERACAEPVNFTNDTPQSVFIRPKHDLLDVAVLKDTTAMPHNVAPKASAVIQSAIRKVRANSKTGGGRCSR